MIPQPNRSPRIHGLVLACLAAGVLAFAQAQAQQPLIDAGGMANQMHQHALMRQQSGADGADAAADPPAQDPAAFLASNPAARAEFKQRVERHRRELLPGYEHRVATEGQAQANAWLEQEAARRGRQDALELQRKYAGR